MGPYSVRVSYDAHEEDSRGPRPAYCAPFPSRDTAVDWARAHCSGRSACAVVVGPAGPVVRVRAVGGAAEVLDHD